MLKKPLSPASQKLVDEFLDSLDEPMKPSPATRGRNELLTALRDANEGWLPGVGKVFTVTLDPAERDILTSALSEIAPSEGPEWVCTECGSLGKVRDKLYYEGDADVECTVCGSVQVEEGYNSAIHRVIDERDKLRAEKQTTLSAIGTRDAALEEAAAICDQQAEAWQQAHNEGSEILAYEDQALHGVANLIRTLKGKS